MGFSHCVAKYFPNKGQFKILLWRPRKNQMINYIKNYIHRLQHMRKVYMIVGSPINRERLIILGQIWTLVDNIFKYSWILYVLMSFVLIHPVSQTILSCFFVGLKKSNPIIFINLFLLINWKAIIDFVFSKDLKGQFRKMMARLCQLGLMSKIYLVMIQVDQI